MKLYNESLETLLNSNCADFGVSKCSKDLGFDPEIISNLFEIEGHSLINEKNYHILYLNICQKVRAEKKVIFAKR